MACDSCRKDTGFVSSGITRGSFKSLILNQNESYAGLLKDIEIAVLYDKNTFRGRLKNEASEAICDVRIAIILDDSQTVNTTQSGSQLQIDGLNRNGRQDFTLVPKNTAFSTWRVEIESFTCSKSPKGEGNEGGEEGSEDGEEGDEHGEEGEGSETNGSENNDESNPPIPLTSPFSGVFNNLNFDFSFDKSVSAFRGVVKNQTSQLVCQSRVEVHVATGSQVIELGPTIGVDLASGETVNVVLQINGFTISTYSLHPESSPCR